MNATAHVCDATVRGLRRDTIRMKTTLSFSFLRIIALSALTTGTILSTGCHTAHHVVDGTEHVGRKVVHGTGHVIHRTGEGVGHVGRRIESHGE